MDQTQPIVTDNDDGTVTLRLAGGRSIELPEPTALQYAKVWDLLDQADQALPPLPALSEDAGPEERAARSARVTERRQIQYSERSPHALALIEIVRLLTGEDLTMADLHRHSMKPQVGGDLLAVWEAPLGGPAEPVLPSPLAPVAPTSPDPGSVADVPSSPPGTGDSHPSRLRSSTG